MPPCRANAATEASRAAATSGTSSSIPELVASTSRSRTSPGSGSSATAAARSITEASSRCPAATTAGAVTAIAAIAAQEERSCVRGLWPWSLASLSLRALGASVFS
jgi:hypothetical protein